VNLTIDISGVSKLFKNAPGLIIKELDKSAKTGLVAIQRDARRTHRFHRQSGNLQRSVTVDFKSFTASKPGGIYLELGLAPYAAAIHDGSRPHKIYAKNKKALAFTKGGKTIMVPKNPHKMPGYLVDGNGDSNVVWSQKGYVDHPGTKPDRFLYEAAQRGQKNLINELNKGVARAIAKTIRG
jgi:hypothetical protein